jgi:hypothetical protein
MFYVGLRGPTEGPAGRSPVVEDQSGRAYPPSAAGIGSPTPPPPPIDVARPSLPAPPSPAVPPSDNAGGIAALPQPVPALADIEAQVRALPCSALASALDENRLTLSGYTADRAALERLRSELAARSGITEVSVASVRSLDAVYCRMLETLAPQINRNREADLAERIHTTRSEAKYRAGDKLAFTVTAPAAESYITVDYFSRDGRVVHMLPSGSHRDNRAAPGSELSIGDADRDNWIVGPPFGTEVIALIAGPEPLFTKRRKEAEPAEAYLRDLRRGIERIEGRPGAAVLADLMIIETSAGEP